MKTFFFFSDVRSIKRCTKCDTNYGEERSRCFDRSLGGRADAGDVLGGPTCSIPCASWIRLWLTFVRGIGDPSSTKMIIKGQ